MVDILVLLAGTIALIQGMTCYAVAGLFRATGRVLGGAGWLVLLEVFAFVLLGIGLVFLLPGLGIDLGIAFAVATIVPLVLVVALQLYRRKEAGVAA